MPDRSTRLDRLVWFVVTFFALWIVWVLILIRYPRPLEHWTIHAAARLLVWLGSAAAYIRIFERLDFLSYLRLRDRAGKGVLWGVVVSILLIGPVIVYRLHFARAPFHLSRDFSTWMNPVLTAPVAEEVVFRGIIFQKLDAAIGTLRAVVLSALLFALIHAPYWYLSGVKAGKALAVSLGGIFVYGVVFAGLLRLTRSLWTPMVYHFLNNLVSLSWRG
jgi:membrane protease YdiL (CAAX protease family)